MTHRRWRGLAAAALALSSMGAAAATIAGVSPQGDAAAVRQVVVRFDRAVVPAGDPRQAPPVTVACEGSAAAGNGRWLDERRWVWDFTDVLPPGLRCTVAARPGWQPLGGALTGRTEFRFATGGPAVVQTQPWAGARIEEDQHFILRLNGPVPGAVSLRQAWCEVEGLGERLPVQPLAGPARDALLKARRLEADAARTLVVHCGRPLPANARVQLVWGKGIAAPQAPAVLTSVEQRFDFRVREAFQAEFSCERERANAPCLPVRPLLLRFSAPVARALAEQVRLQSAGGGPALAPNIDRDDKAGEFSELSFKGPFAERARLTLTLPPQLRDTSGRPLANAGSFPLTVATGEAPPIAKLAAAPFGVLEHTAEAMLPITLRHVQGDLRPAAPGGQVRVKRLETDAEVIAWYRKLDRFHETRLSARELGRPQAEWQEWVQETDDQGKTVRRQVERLIATRELSLLAGEAGARRLDLPQLQGGDPRPFEVVGLPLPEPGYHVVEVESRRLGQALLDKAAPMYVRTGVLVTNLAVHLKRGRENAVVWVTSLDRGRPVADAEVVASDCEGRRLWAGRTDAAGLARVPLHLDAPEACSDGEAIFVSARHTTKAADGRERRDMAFVFDGWSKGIEPWRFDLPVSSDAVPDHRAHTVFDRTLLRAGETVAMKHFVRRESLQGLALLPAAELPTRLKVIHEGSDETFEQPLQWSASRSAVSSWNIPPAARLGRYRVELDNPQAPESRRRSWPSGSFRVEAFRVPLVDARIAPPTQGMVAPAELAFGVQLNYGAGGPVAQAPLKGSALLRPRAPGFAGYEEVSFEPPRDLRAGEAGGDESRRPEGRLLADAVVLSTDRQGAARFVVGGLPAIERPTEVLAEVAFKDPNGEVQTVATTVALWPAAVVPGIRTGGWSAPRGRARFTALALDTAGRPLKDQALEVRGRLAQIIGTRKRLVGGFYAYEQRTEVQDLGLLCSGRSDALGRLDCEAALSVAGQVELIVSAQDAAGRSAQAAASLWVTRQGELWFEQGDDDRIELLAAKKRYEGGESAKLQVRMPFREATALVTVEREGVIDSRVITLRGDDPTVELKIDKAWAPNAYVSVLVLRGRLRDVPWYSFFRWGWQSPLEWARAFWYEGREYQAPTAMVDLARPAFRLGVAALQVGQAAHELQVTVAPEHAQYTVRAKARVKVQVRQDGQPVPGAEVAFAAVDEGLLALQDNDSWQLLPGLLGQRAWGVQTATAQGEVIGRRHFGRKAVAAGGGGGRGATRELFDTLLLWQPRVLLDARGEAVVEVPVNDALTRFRLVAVADDGGQRFGTGSAAITVSQDLQILAGLPPLVRDGDRFTAMLTLRNTTSRELRVQARLQGTAAIGMATGNEISRMPLQLPPQAVSIPAGGATGVSWPVEVPADAVSITWEAAVDEQGGSARDRLKTVQLVDPAVPLRVLQATLLPLDGTATLPVAAPEGALRGGLAIGLQPRLSSALPGLRRFFETYPFSCLEQQAAKAIGLRDAALWARLAEALPTYLDEDGLAGYFAPRPGDAARGSDRLTAHLVAVAHEAGLALPAAAQDRMLAGLLAFVEGRIERRGWSPRPDLDVRKLAALEALSRHGRATPRLLGSINLTPALWPTAALIDWLRILQRVDAVPERARRLAEAQQLLRARLDWQGTTLRFSTESSDDWWWLMDGADANAARLILALLPDPAWRDELPRLLIGALARQQRGAWQTTTANVWGALALEGFARRFEAQPVAGRTQAGTGGVPQVHDWAAAPDGGRLRLPWPAQAGAQAGTLTVTHSGGGQPWLTVQSLAALPLSAPLQAGYAITRSVTPVQRADPQRWSRGDVLRVRLQVDASADRTWVVVADPVPGGATVLGSGLGRDSAIATRGERSEGQAWASYDERGADSFKRYFEVLPRGRHVVEYTLRLNNPGRFQLPPTRVEAMYAPETFGEAPNAPIEVMP